MLFPIFAVALSLTTPSSRTVPNEAFAHVSYDSASINAGWTIEVVSVDPPSSPGLNGGDCMGAYTSTTNGNWAVDTITVHLQGKWGTTGTPSTHFMVDVGGQISGVASVSSQRSGSFSKVSYEDNGSTQLPIYLRKAVTGYDEYEENPNPYGNNYISSTVDSVNQGYLNFDMKVWAKASWNGNVTWQPPS